MKGSGSSAPAHCSPLVVYDAQGSLPGEEPGGCKGVELGQVTDPGLG